MKVQLVFTLLMAFFQCLPAKADLNLEIPDCRFNYYEIDFNTSLKEQFRKDLMSGIWKEEAVAPSKIQQTVQFHDYGLVETFTYKKGKFIGHELALWRIEEFNNGIFLVWINTQMEQENLLEVQQTCDGIVLTNVETKEVLNFNYKPNVDTKAKQFAESTLQGNWDNATYPFDLTDSMNDCGTFEVMKKAFLKYKFNEDGTYEKTYGNAKVELKESGIWEVSEDGGFVVFLATIDQDPEQVYQTSVAKIRHINIDELVLEQALSSHEFNDLFCTKIKTLAFVK